MGNAEGGTENAEGGTRNELDPRPRALGYATRRLRPIVPSMQHEDLRDRTRRFAVRAIHFVKCLPPTPGARVVGDQLLRSATSVAANYRAARRARSPREFIAKLGVVEEEADETAFWLELVVEAGIVEEKLVHDLHKEAHEVTAIVVASIKTVRARGLQVPRS